MTLLLLLLLFAFLVATLTTTLVTHSYHQHQSISNYSNSRQPQRNNCDPQQSSSTFYFHHHHQKRNERVFRVSRHDNTTLTSLLWYRGQRFDGKRQLFDQKYTHNHDVSLVIDALTIGRSKSFEYLIEGQAASWVRHKSIRYFFGTTHYDHQSPSCQTNLSTTQLLAISNHDYNSSIYKHNGDYFANNNTTTTKTTNTTATITTSLAWKCTHSHFASSLARLGRFYRRELASDYMNLPHYLLLQRDDTFFNMIYIQNFLKGRNPSRPEAFAGCLQHPPSHYFLNQKQKEHPNFPTASHGFILSFAVLEQLIRPIHCSISPNNNTTFSGAWNQKICQQLEKDVLGEANLWQNGDSLTDLMAKHALFLQFSSSPSRFYMHGDSLLGYYMSHYLVGTTNDDENQESSLDGIQYRPLQHDCKTDNTKHSPNNCDNVGIAKCNITHAHVCNKLHAVTMTFLSHSLDKSYPRAFRPVPLDFDR